MIFLSLCMVGVLTLLSNSDLRENARRWYRGADRKILATIEDDLRGDGSLVSVFKIKENGALYLEFYLLQAKRDGTVAAEQPELIQRMELPNSIDGYVTIMGQATNLAVANLDGDPLLELLVPSYNLEFAASLEIVKYNAGLGKFQLMPSFEVPEDLTNGVRREAR